MVVWTGTLLGIVLGLTHAFYVYRVSAGSQGETPDPVRGLYFAGWTLGLWVLFGTYVLVLWVAGLALYLVFKAFR